jgi:adenosylcobinamide kinase/adenosylcobinamide-phosphate guanylyltransferase
VILVTGGVRSGKSAFAERYAARLAGAAGEVVYVATARVWDGEMARRVARHQESRPASWHTVEAPTDLGAALARPPAATARVVLVDSVDFWVSNRLLDTDPVHGEQIDHHRLAALEQSLLRDVEGLTAPPQAHAPPAQAPPARGERTLLLVTLEAGLGVVPPSPLGRAFRDLLGRVNQALAAAAAEVYLMVAGLPVDVARLSRETGLSLDQLREESERGA